MYNDGSVNSLGLHEFYPNKTCNGYIISAFTKLKPSLLHLPKAKSLKKKAAMVNHAPSFQVYCIS